MFDDDEPLHRRTVLQSAAGSAAGLGALGAAERTTAAPSTGGTPDPVPGDITIQFKLYPHQYRMEVVAEEIKEAYETHLAPQLEDIGVTLDVSIVGYPDDPQSLDEFEQWVEDETDHTESGNAVHIWVHWAVETDGANTPPWELVDGSTDAVVDMSMRGINEHRTPARRNIYLHEALHAMMEEGGYDFDSYCYSHDAGNDDEHTCGAVRAERHWQPWKDDKIHVTPMIGTYDEDDFGANCGGTESNWPSERVYEPDLSSCTYGVIRNFFYENREDLRSDDGGGGGCAPYRPCPTR